MSPGHDTDVSIASRRPTTSHLFVCLLGFGAISCGEDEPCDGVATACVAVELTGDGFVDTIAFDIVYGGEHDTIARPATELPSTIAIELAPDEPIDVQILAAGIGNGSATGAGFATTPAPLANGAHVHVSIALAPNALDCTPGDDHCGGDGIPGDPATVYRCVLSSAPAARGACANGCDVATGACKAGDPCTAGDYCGGDKVPGDPQSLYRCTGGGAFTLVRECGARCVVRSLDDDVCID